MTLVEAHTRDFFDHDRVADVVHSGAAISLGQRYAGQPQLRRFLERVAWKASRLVNFLCQRLHLRLRKFPHAFL
jgi:hypothetical protein